MDLGLKGKVAVVTGGTQGIGRATALRLAQEGAHVAICSRTQEALDDTAAEIQKFGVQGLGVCMQLIPVLSLFSWMLKQPLPA